MTFNIANFSAHINDLGTVQTNKFRVEIGRPRALLRANIDQTYQYRASSVRIPGVNFDMQNVNRYGVGPLQKFPTNVNFTDVDVTFLDTRVNALWKYFTIWMNVIFDYTGQSGGSQAAYSVEYKTNYVTDVNIYVYENSGGLVNKITLKDAFPVSLNDVNLSWNENNRLYEFTTRFTFKEWFYEGYQVGQFVSGSQVGPAASAEVIPQRTESPRPQRTESPRPAPRSDPFGLNATPGNETGTAGPVNPSELNF